MALRHAILATCISILGVGHALASTEFLYYEDRAGEIHELALQTTNQWKDTQITTKSGTTPSAQITGNTLSYVTEGNGAKHIFFIGSDGNIDEVTSTTGSWQPQPKIVPLNSLTGAPSPQGGRFITMGDAWGQYVFYFSGSGDVIELFTCPVWPPTPKANGKSCTSGTWEFTDLTTPPKGSNNMPAPKGANYMSSTSDTDGDHVYYFSSNGDLQHLLFTGSPRTAVQVIDYNTTTTGNAFAGGTNPAPTLTSFYDSWGEHVFFAESNIGHIYCSGGCSQQPVPNSQTYALPNMTPVTGFSDIQGEHVFYLDANFHLCEAYYDGSKWSRLDYSLGTPNVGLITTQSPLLGFPDSTGEHVFYLDGNGLLNEMTAIWTSKGLPPRKTLVQTDSVVHTTTNQTVSPLWISSPVSNTITGFVQ